MFKRSRNISSHDHVFRDSTHLFFATLFPGLLNAQSQRQLFFVYDTHTHTHFRRSFFAEPLSKNIAPNQPNQTSFLIRILEPP